MKNGFKHASLSVFLSAMLLGSWSVAQAVPLYYEVSGKINEQTFFWDREGLIPEMGFSVGDRISFTFLIDLDSDITSTWTQWYGHTYSFDMALVSSNVFGSAPIAEGELYPEDPWGGVGSTQINDLNAGFIPAATRIYGYSPTGLVQIDNYDRIFADGLISEFQPGDRFSHEAYVRLFGDNGNDSYLYVDNFYIDSVSAERPTTSVSEPGVIWLFSVGMLGMAIRRVKYSLNPPHS
jgi:hypothetical protein